MHMEADFAKFYILSTESSLSPDTRTEVRLV